MNGQTLNLNSFNLSDQDMTDSNATYLGYLQINGRWIIAKSNESTGETRYAYGLSGYSDAWTNRTGLTYVLFNQIII